MQGDGFLHRYMLNNGGKRLRKWIHYFDIYERHLERFRGRAPVMLEIGVDAGGSLEMWRQYLGPGARILGLDINPACKAHEGEGVEVFIGAQDDEAVIAAILERHPVIDIVLDDGGHQQKPMRRSFELLYDRLAPDGIYMAEDLHACYWPRFGGGLRKPGSFVEHAKAKVDELHAQHIAQALPPTRFTATTQSICFYDSIVVFERRPQGKRQAPVSEGLTLPEA